MPHKPAHPPTPTKAHFPPYDDKPVLLHPGQIETDAKLFQFKSGGDQHGKTGVLDSIQTWESAFSNVILVWKPQGEKKYYNADGHQRLGRAKELERDAYGHKIRLRAIVLKEKDGWTPQLARAFAAAKNITEGSYSTLPLDIAEFVRNGGPVDYLGKIVSSKNKGYRQGINLTKLGDEAYGIVKNTHITNIPVTWGSIVGEMVPGDKQQVAVLSAMKDHFKKQDPRQETIYDFVGLALRAGFEQQTQENLFGETDLFGDKQMRARILDQLDVLSHARAHMRSLVKTFRGANRHTDEFRAYGSQINKPEIARAREDLKVLELCLGQVHLKGDVADALKNAAEILHQAQPAKADAPQKSRTQRRAEASAQFMAALREIAAPLMPRKSPPPANEQPQHPRAPQGGTQAMLMDLPEDKGGAGSQQHLMM